MTIRFAFQRPPTEIDIPACETSQKDFRPRSRGRTGTVTDAGDIYSTQPDWWQDLAADLLKSVVDSIGFPGRNGETFPQRRLARSATDAAGRHPHSGCLPLLVPTLSGYVE